jgi:hypothetical protein
LVDNYSFDHPGWVEIGLMRFGRFGYKGSASARFGIDFVGKLNHESVNGPVDWAWVLSNDAGL